jgi:urease accessory protein
MMDGQLSATFAQGFVSGVGQPIIGIDHFLFIVGVRLLAGFMGRRLLLPLAFVLGTWGGAAVHLFGLNIAFAEIAILASIALMAVAVIGNIRMPALLTAGLVAGRSGTGIRGDKPRSYFECHRLRTPNPFDHDLVGR